MPTYEHFLSSAIIFTIEEEFYTLLLQLLSYGTILAVERQTWCGTARTCPETRTHLYGALGAPDTALTSQTPAANSRPFDSNTLNLLPVKHLQLESDTISCCGSSVEQTPLGPVLAGLPCQQTGFTFGKKTHFKTQALCHVSFLHRML